MHSKRLLDLKDAAMREVEHEVAKAEGLAKDVTQLCTVLCNDEKLMEMSVLEMKDASSRSVQAEQAANTALADARKIITMRRMGDDPKLVADGNEAIAFIKKAEMKINELSADMVP